jgi:hypothetical protein
MTNFYDSLFSINSNIRGDSKSDVASASVSFVYNRYKNDETSINDIGISDRGAIDLIKPRFVRIEFKFNRLINPNYNSDNFSYKAYNLSLLDSIDISSLKKFNKVSYFNNNRKTLTTDLDYNEVQKSYNFYKDDDEDVSIINIRKLQSSYKVSFKKDLNIKNILTQKDFPEKDLSEHLELYDEMINVGNTSRQRFFVNAISNGILFPGVVTLCQNINDNQTLTDFSRKNAVFCGILIEKYLKEGSSSYKYLGSKFYTSKPTDTQLSLRNRFEDENVAYGKTYRYVTSRVYLYNWPDPNDHYITNRFLLCDNPFITKDIVCVENEAPPPPREINFRVNKKNDLVIKWKFPKDYQEDGRGIQVLRRFRVEDPFTVIAQLEGHSQNDLYEKNENVLEQNIVKTPNKLPHKYVDKEYQSGRIAIYALRLIDAHGLVSDYSVQTAILYDPFEEKVIYDIISPEGAKRDKPNEKIRNKTLFFQNEVNVIDNLPFLKNVNKISLYLTPAYTKVSREENENLNVYENNNTSYKFTMLKINTLTKYEKSFNVKNFINS